MVDYGVYQSFGNKGKTYFHLGLGKKRVGNGLKFTLAKRWVKTGTKVWVSLGAIGKAQGNTRNYPDSWVHRDLFTAKTLRRTNSEKSFGNFSGLLAWVIGRGISYLNWAGKEPQNLGRASKGNRGNWHGLTFGRLFGWSLGAKKYRFGGLNTFGPTALKPGARLKPLKSGRNYELGL